MFAILSKLSILFINYILRDLDNTKILLYKLFVRYLVVKPACVNAALVSHQKIDTPQAQSIPSSVRI